MYTTHAVIKFIDHCSFASKNPNDALNKFSPTVKYANNFIMSPT